MLRKVTQTDFIELIPVSLYLSPDYMNSTAKIMRAKPVYLIFFKDQKPQVAFALFEKGRRIVQPAFYPLYSGIWLNGDLESSNLRNDLFKSISALTKLYKSIKMALPPNIQDVRAFIWNGFKLQLKYTYIKDLSVLNYKHDVLKNYRRTSGNLIFSLTNIKSCEWEVFEKQLSELNFRLKNINNLQKWIAELDSNNLVKTFSVKDLNEKHLGYGILILDEQHRRAGFLLSYGIKGQLQSEVNAYLYVEIHQWLADNKYQYFDYLGANTKSIAEFKSRFNPELKSYFLVKYSFYGNWLKKSFTVLKVRAN